MFNTKRLLPVTAIFLLAGLGLFAVADDLSAGPYLDSGHGGSNVGGQGVLRLPPGDGYTAGNCAHCHEQHASIGGSEPAPDNNKASERLLFSDLKTSGYADNTFCLYCHGGTTTSNGEDNIFLQFDKAAGVQHDPATLVSMNLVNGEVTCLKCHNPHEAQTTTHNEGADGNVVSGALQGVSGVSASWAAPVAPSSGAESLSTPAYTSIDPITMEYQLCLKCHSTEESASATPPTPLGGHFNPNNAAVHQVDAAAWKNTWLANNATTAMTGGWNLSFANTGKGIYCSDCHSSDGVGSPQGPHGSTNSYILKRTDAGGTRGVYDDLCLGCHNPTLATGGSSQFNNAAGLGHNNSNHQYNIAGPNFLGCIACHGGSAANGDRTANIHGTNYKWPDVGDGGLTSAHFLVGGYITQNYTQGANRMCNATCHGGGAGGTHPY